MKLVTMWKLKSSLIVCTLFCYFLEIHGSSFDNFTRQWTSDYMFTPDIISINGRLIAIGLPNNTVNITSTFDKVDPLTCKLPLKPGEVASDKIKAFVLGNGKIVIHTSVLVKKKMAEFKLEDSSWDLFIILEAHNCSSLKTVEIHHGYYRNYAGLVPYQSSFDVFYNKKPIKDSETIQTPQRFDDLGEPIKLDYSLGLESQLPYFAIQLIKPFDASEGYISSINSTINYHNQRFEIIKSKNITHTLYNFSGTYGKISHCHIKYPPKTKTMSDGKKIDFHNNEDGKTEENVREFCEILDDDLNTKVSVEMHNLESKRPYQGIVTNLADGGALVATAYRGRRKSNNGYPMEFYLQRINPDGRTREPVLISAHSIFYHRMKLIPLENEEYCLVDGGEMEPFKPFTSLKNSMWITCINLSSL